MNKEEVVHPHTRILLSLEKAGDSDTHHDMDEPENTMPSEISKPQRTILYIPSYARSLEETTETESRKVAGAKGHRLCSISAEGVLRMGNGGRCASWVHN